MHLVSAPGAPCCGVLESLALLPPPFFVFVFVFAKIRGLRQTKTKEGKKEGKKERKKDRKRGTQSWSVGS